MLIGTMIVIILGILCKGDFYQNSPQKEFQSDNDRDLNETGESWSYENVTSRMPLERNERSVNKSEPDTAYRIAGLDESKNSSSTSVNKSDEHTLLVTKFKRMWPVWHWKQLGYFSDDYLDLINVHWLQFPPPDERLQKILGCLYLLFATVGCWGNVIVLFMYSR